MIRIPWTNETSPNVMLEITNQCNLTCSACYAIHGNEFKSLQAIQNELAAAKTLRPIDTITITGGEPLLHPELPEIISMIAKSGYNVFLLTNGILADKETLQHLKKAGLNDILFHVDLGQHRTDLPTNPSQKDVFRKQEELIQIAIDVGLDPSISFTIYDDSPETISSITDWFLHLENGTMLFLSRATDPNSLQPINRIIFNNLSLHLKQTYNLAPFSYIPATGKKNPPLWYSYFIPINVAGSVPVFYPYKGTFADRLLIWAGKTMNGKFTHRMPKSAPLICFRVATNALATGRLHELLKFYMSHPTQPILTHKIIAYDDGPHLSIYGEIVRCEFCPTAIIKDKNLVRCCELQSIEKVTA